MTTNGEATTTSCGTQQKPISTNGDGDFESDESCGIKIMCMKTRMNFPLLQRFAKPPYALAALSFVALLQGIIVNGMINGTLSTLITRFSLTGSQAGLIASCYDIGVCLSLLVVTYIGGQGHKPKWLGWGSVLMGIGAIIFSLPHFGAPPHQASLNGDSDSCDVTRNGSSSSFSECSYNENLRNYRYLFYIAQGIIGVGASPLYTLGITYLDENVPQIKSSLYHGIFYALSIVGPGIGYLMAGIFLNIYTNLGSTTPLTSDDSQFIGAWWLGFMIFGFVALIPSAIVLMLPKQLPGTEEVRRGRGREMHQDSLATKVAEQDEFGKTLKDFPVSVLVILRNAAFVFVTISGCTDGMITSGLATFLPKVIESLFNMSSSFASVIIGLIAIVGGAGGQFIGGLVVTKMNLNVRGIIKFNLCMMILATLCSIILLKSCDNADFAGANVFLAGSSNTPGEVTATCNLACGCTKEVYDPVCGSDNITYFSACYAGCTNSTGDLYTGCSCVTGDDGTASSGVCTAQACGRYLYLIVLFLSLFFTFVVAVPSIQISVRVVPFTQRTFAIGFQWLMVRVLGTIPGPLLYGYLLDKACLIRGDSCGEESSCKVYENDAISMNVVICTIVLKVVGLMSVIAVYLLYKPNETSDDSGEDREDAEGRQNTTSDHLKESSVSSSEGSKANHSASPPNGSAKTKAEHAGVINKSFTPGEELSTTDIALAAADETEL